MKVCVTGAAGYIGAVVVDNLVKAGHQVFCVDKLMYTETFLRDDVDFERLDVTSPAFIEYLQKHSFDAIVHLAAIVGDPACQLNPELTVRTNEIATKAIADYIYLFKPGTRFIFASTCSVYGASDGLLNETSSAAPLSLYAQTKLISENYIKKLGLSNAVIFRLGTLYGLSGPHGRIRSDLVANIMTFKACENQQLSVFGGDQWRPLLHVRDAGRIFADAVDADYTGTVVLSHRNYKIKDIAEAIVKITRTTSEVLSTDVKFEDLRNYKVDNRKALKLGIIPEIGLEEGIAELATAYKKGRIKNPWAAEFNNAKYLRGTQ